MEIYTVTFLGHRTIHNMREVEERLDELIRKLLREKYYVDFLVGRNGEFDTMASAAIRRAKQAIGDHNSTFTLVLPYLTAEYAEQLHLWATPTTSLSAGRTQMNDVAPKVQMKFSLRSK